MKERVAAHSKRSLAPEIKEAVDGDRSDSGERENYQVTEPTVEERRISKRKREHEDAPL